MIKKRSSDDSYVRFIQLYFPWNSGFSVCLFVMRTSSLFLCKTRLRRIKHTGLLGSLVLVWNDLHIFTTSVVELLHVILQSFAAEQQPTDLLTLVVTVLRNYL